VELTVDGRSVEVAEGASVLEAARRAGAHVSTLCHDDRFAPSGVCRVCLVAADGIAVAACATPATPGMRVVTTDPALAGQVRLTLELLTERLPARAFDRPTELAELCRRFDIEVPSGGRGLGRDESHPYFTLDRDLCIACGRCVRMCDEVQGTFALTLVGRGADTVVAPGTGGPWVESVCVSCGSCVDSCPSGALAERWSGSDTTVRTTRTTCGYCGVGCTLDVTASDDGGDGDRVLSVSPALDGPVNHGHACVKGRFAHDFVRSPERLTTPLLRRDGELQPVSWTEALEYVGRELGRIRATYGPDSIAAISSARATNEENYLMQKLMRAVIGTNNVDNCSRICHAPSAAGLTASFGLSGGTNPSDDIERADVFLLAGSNASEAHPVIGARIRQQVLRGAKLVVIDPRRTELAELADVHLRCRPGSNVAVFNGLARLLLDEGWTDLDFLTRRADGLDELRDVLEAYSPQRVEEISGVAPGLLRKAAHLYGCASHPAIYYGLGVTEHAHGTDCVRTLANLAILRGAVGTSRGGGVNPLRGQNNVQGASDMGALPDVLPGYQKVTDGAARERIADAWGVPLPERPGLRIPDMFAGALDGRVRALYVMGEDIAQTDPDSHHVRAAIEACELVVSQEIFLSETAQLAHVVLPAASFLEKDGTFVNFDRRFQRVRPALPPPTGARTDFDILLGVAEALGGDLGLASPAEAMVECAAVAPLFAGVSHDRLDRDGALHWPCRSVEDPGTPRLYEKGFETSSGRAQLAPVDWLPPGERPDTEFPYLLITGRRLQHYNSGTMTRRTPNLALLPDEHLDVNPDDLARLGLADGDRGLVSSRRGSVTVHVRATDAVAPGQVFLAFHFPGIATNVLTSDVVDAVTSCPEYKVSAVSIRPA
jgi:formate dehydrogenase major subunit